MAEEKNWNEGGHKGEIPGRAAPVDVKVDREPGERVHSVPVDHSDDDKDGQHRGTFPGDNVSETTGQRTRMDTHINTRTKPTGQTHKERPENSTAPLRTKLRYDGE